MTFSSRVHESAVQFVDPVQTEAASRTTYLWCMRSGTPGIAAVGNGCASSASGFVSGGGGTGTAFAWSRLYARRTATPRFCAATSSSQTIVVEVRRQLEVVDRDLECLLRGAAELGERVGGLLGRLAAVRQRADFDASHSAL